MADLPRDYSHLTNRPPVEDRLFRSTAAERVIEEIAEKIHDPIIRRMWRQTYPNTLDTTAYFRETAEGKPDTVVVTGDIPAMWPRDSASQTDLYLPLAKEDEGIKRLLAGLIFRQAECMLIDPYANAFVDPYVDDPPKTPHWPHGDGWHPKVWERKWEPDTPAAYFTLSHKYFDATKDATPFDDHWIEASVTALDTLRAEQQPIKEDTKGTMYRGLMPNGAPFPDTENWGMGHPNKYTGMVRGMYRPSDDVMKLPYNIPTNAMLVVALDGMARVLKNIRETQLADEFMFTAHQIDDGIKQFGIANHPTYGQIYAYEVDGFGGQLLMDDPNVPSLLSLPSLGYCFPQTGLYKATREFVLSPDNPYNLRGKRMEGQASPHTGLDKIWPLATCMRIMTSDDDDEIKTCLRQLRDTTFGTYFMHEAINVDDPSDYTRPWFGWANSLFAKMVLDLARRKPWILAGAL